MTRVGIITQARMTSTRLPGKVLLDAGGRTMLDHHIDRLLTTALPVVVATTSNATDDPIVAAADAREVTTFRGSESDVLGRFAGACRTAELDAVVRVTSDCPLLDGELIAQGVERYLQLGDRHAYVSNTVTRTYPRGFDFEVFSADALYEADRMATYPADREHVTPYLHQNRTGRTAVDQIARTADASRFRVTLDTHDDLRLLRQLITRHDAHLLTCEQIIRVLETNPALGALNSHVQQKKLQD
ncbi:glycosyltransferase family protein [Microbacterium sp. Re1]|uniref:Glycosyltransferase family protein n=1 Tax=Microbacterium commune TaxID=2762219 RepID=A0ABR8W1S6_9MICO|nr:glycosyltransferase family protein [Microbacterium commune]MBD8010983.1 glycosyltransferase family protein [Microbacterium commune]